MKIQSPSDLRALGLVELRELAEDMRQKILSSCLKNGGHLGASLGVVELSIALHRVFESPREPIFWDVGHQAYAHKLLTGRWDRFSSLRTTGGISGFLSRDESEHDVFGAGHSSTALSASLASAWARRGRPGWTVAVIGDGGLTGGVALEAMNNVRALELGPLLVVVNDNQMSIAPNVGAIPWILSGRHAKSFFEHFGFDYVGPVDGHDLSALIGTLEGLRQGYGGQPVLLHVLTQKGKGYVPAEESPEAYHGVSPLRLKISEKNEKAPGKTYSEAFGETLCTLAGADDRIVAITAAMSDGTGLDEFARRYPDRFFDVGIAEPHAVTFAAGLAAQGFRPVVAIYSTFLQRALDPIIHDIALQRLGVTLAIDRAGIVGPDGPTHHGAFDLAFLGMIPGVRVAAPACLEDLSWLLSEAVNSRSPFVIRYPRGGGVRKLEAGVQDGVRWHQRAESPQLILVALGAPAARVARVARELDPEIKKITAVSTVFAKPIVRALLDYLSINLGAKVLCVEDGCVYGGFGGELLSESLDRQGRAVRAGYGDRFIPHGAVSDLEETEGLSAAGLRERILKLLG